MVAACSQRCSPPRAPLPAGDSLAQPVQRVAQPCLAIWTQLGRPRLTRGALGPAAPVQAEAVASSRPSSATRLSCRPAMRLERWRDLGAARLTSTAAEACQANCCRQDSDREAAAAQLGTAARTRVKSRAARAALSVASCGWPAARQQVAQAPKIARRSSAWTQPASLAPPAHPPSRWVLLPACSRSSSGMQQDQNSCDLSCLVRTPLKGTASEPSTSLSQVASAAGAHAPRAARSTTRPPS